MRINKYQWVLLIMLLLQYSCKDKNNTKVIIKTPINFSETIIQSTELDTKFIAATKNTGGKSGYFFCGMVNLHDNEYFTFLDKADSLTFIAMDTKAVHKINFKPILKDLDEYRTSQISDSNIFLLNRETYHFYQYHINKDFSVELRKKINLNKSGKLKGLGFHVIPDATRFICKDSLLFINYSAKKNKNYIDNEAILFFNLNDPDLKPTFLIEYPKNYYKEEIRSTELLFTMPNDSSLAFGFMQNDAIGIYHNRSNSIAQTQLNRKNGYLVFDENKHGNLGYTSKYLQINENNYQLFSDSTQRIYLFKRLAKAQKTDTTVMECYVFDTQLNPIHYFKLNQEVCPSYIYKYQKGFLAFTKDLTKAYYYEF